MYAKSCDNLAYPRPDRADPSSSTNFALAYLERTVAKGKGERAAQKHARRGRAAAEHGPTSFAQTAF